MKHLIVDGILQVFYKFGGGRKRMNTQIIKEYEQKLLTAMQAHDVLQLDLLLHDDLLFIIPDGSTITKSMDLEAHRSGAMVIERIATTIEQISTIEDVAVVTLRMETKGSMLGSAIEGEFRYIRVWKKMTDRYCVIAGSCTRI